MKYTVISAQKNRLTLEFKEPSPQEIAALLERINDRRSCGLKKPEEVMFIPSRKK